jgi:hypothetical protein
MGQTPQEEQLREEWADVMARVSTCRELEVLALPRIEVEPLFPPGTAFARLTHLEISDFEREHPPDAGVMGLWELMASGGLPVLAKLKVTRRDRWERGWWWGRWGRVEDVKRRVAPAFEAVASSLTHLSLAYPDAREWLAGAYEFGVAVGKLRRLKDLALDLSRDGRPYHAFAQGLAASGGDSPLPLLWRMGVAAIGKCRPLPPVLQAVLQACVIDKDVGSSADMLASLLLPSVRVFVSSHRDPQGALLTACALRQAGYKHTWAVDYPPEVDGAVRAIVQCRLRDRACL